MPPGNQVSPSEESAFSYAEGRSPSPAADDRASTPTLLYIDDNRSNIELMTQIVNLRPHWTLTAALDGNVGLEMAVASPPQLILLDLHLPDPDGLEVLHRLRADGHNATTPIILVSADAHPDQIEHLLDEGVVAYLTMPLELSDVLAILDTYQSGAGPNDTEPARPSPRPSHLGGN